MKQRARYPAIPLPEAVARVEAIYKQEGKNGMINEVAVRHMGYSSLNGASMSVLAALKKYGLLEGRGDEIKVSHDAVIIVSDRGIDDQTERAEALRRCLLSDPLFSELQERFLGKTTVLNVASYLQKKGFKPAAAQNAAKSYIESVAFVEDEVGVYNFRVENGLGPEAMTQAPITLGVSNVQATPQITTNQTQYQEAPIVISGVDHWPIIRLPKKFTAKNWADMMKTLDVMMNGFITLDTDKETQEGN
jgi:hypothetical protein